MNARYDAALAPADITAAQFETLSVLAGLGSCSGRVLAARLALDKTTLSRNLKPLLEAGLMLAQPSDTDGRSINYALSAAGKRRLTKATPLWQAAHDATIAVLGAQAQASERALQRLVQALR
jgi:DNA-binding MarR family transcriptional regulator